jgi:23S rRNA (pseudouridine1915-N3)-methyltransferase
VKITIISVGKKHDDPIKNAIATFETRLKKWVNIEWQIVPPSHLSGQQARDKEPEKMLKLLHAKDKSIIWLLDEIGQQLSTIQLADSLQTFINYSTNIIFVIGGAYGVNSKVRTRADLVWSISRLTLPHQLVRLILIEQLYRAMDINRGGRYHHA